MSEVSIGVRAEKAVLGAVIIKNSVIKEVVGMLNADDFESGTHRKIFEAMTAVYARGTAVDLITVEEEMIGAGERLHLEGGVGSYLVKIANETPTAENVRHYAEIVAKESAKRKFRANCSRLVELMEGADFEELQKTLLEQSKLATEAQRGRTSPGVDMAELAGPLMEMFEERKRAFDRGEPKVVGISTGITMLDVLTNGLHPQTLTIIGARTSLGKTAYACQLALLGAIHRNVPAMFFSLEMSPRELGERFFARLAQVDSQHLRIGELSEAEMERIRLAGRQMYHRGRITISNARLLSDIVTQARAFRVTHPTERILVVVDYLQLVRLGGKRMGTRENEVAEVSATLKTLAMELDCAVVTPAQLKRDPEMEGREPTITDLRESGSVEQDADLILLMSRAREAMARDGYIKVAKNRNGGLGEAAVVWHGPTYEFRDAEAEDQSGGGDDFARIWRGSGVS